MLINAVAIAPPPVPLTEGEKGGGGRSGGGEGK